MELAERVPPFYRERDRTTVYLKILNEQPAPLSARWSALYQDFVSTCLNKDEKARPTADQLLTHQFVAGAEQHREEFIQTVKPLVAC